MRGEKRPAREGGQASRQHCNVDLCAVDRNRCNHPTNPEGVMDEARRRHEVGGAFRLIPQDRSRAGFQPVGKGTKIPCPECNR
jgi:hypothetical protein